MQTRFSYAVIAQAADQFACSGESRGFASRCGHSPGRQRGRRGGGKAFLSMRGFVPFHPLPLLIMRHRMKRYPCQNAKETRAFARVPSSGVYLLGEVCNDYFAICTEV